MRQRTRRDVLIGGAGILSGSLGGCLGSTGAGLGQDGDRRTVQSSFFVTYDFARHVSGDASAVENLVPFGQHGHGWEPGPDVQRRVLESDVLVYVGEGFQPWADDLVENLSTDAPDVAVVEAWADVDLLDATEDDEGDGHDHGGREGQDGDHDGHDEDGDHDETGGGTVDPHYWLDLERAARSAETVASGLADADPSHASTYEENANTYAGRLAELDRTFEAELEDRTTDTVFFAGHNSFQYVGRRYGFTVESLSGLSPDASPSPQDVRRAQEVIEEHDVEHVLAPVFESDRAARQLVEETSAEEVLPLTAVEGLTEEWEDEGWGFVEVMEKVNLPSLRTALGAE